MENLQLYLVVIFPCILLIILVIAIIKYDTKKIKKENYFDEELEILSHEMLFYNVRSINSSGKGKNNYAVVVVCLDELNFLLKALNKRDSIVVLKEVISRIKEVVKTNDFIAKNSNNTFTILLTETGEKEEIELVVNKIIQLLNKPYYIGGREFLLKSFAGVVMGELRDFFTLLSNGVVAMNRALDKGVSGYEFFQQPKTETDQKEITVEDLRQALLRDEFILHYQPQIDIESNTVYGVEALIRWEHPTKGRIPPMSFIPLAESTGLIIPIGFWVIREAVKQYKEWDVKDLVMSINLSAQQLVHEQLVPQIKDVIEGESINPKNLNFEITESISMLNKEQVPLILKDLRDLGVTISIDDFGTGHSSLAYLQKFPISTLKIDRSFVVEGSRSARGRIITKSIVQLAKDLGIFVVAEGVETEEQLKFLQDIECNSIQGYFFSPPLPKDEVLTYLKKFANG